MRLQIFLSHNGVCSRREAMKVIQSGRVSVNGEIVKEPSTPIDVEKDKIVVSGKEIKPKNYDYIIFNKPQGYVTTRHDRFVEKTIYDLLPKEFYHLVPVGRLDQDSEGLLLLTNDGQLTNRLIHPRFHVDKTYGVRMRGRLTTAEKLEVEKGLFIDGTKTSPARIHHIKSGISHTECTITIHEGRNRQVRRMFGQVGHDVTELKRISQGPLKLGSLPTGKFRRLELQEIEQLQKLMPKSPAGPAARYPQSHFKRSIGDAPSRVTLR